VSQISEPTPDGIVEPPPVPTAAPSRWSTALRSRWTRGGLLTGALAVVVAAPIAFGAVTGASAVTIEGASTLSDKVSVNWGKGQDATTDVHVLAWNDFHGNLEPASLNIYGHFAGGAAYLAKLVKDRQAAYGERVATVMAGDNIGASPLANGLFREEPATIVTNMMNVDFGSVGNHEFDKGSAELLRIQKGGCPAAGCNGAPYLRTDGGPSDVYPGANFQYLAANVINQATGKPLLPPSGVKWFHGIPQIGKVGVGFIGEVLQATPTIVTPAGVAGLDFIDEAQAANAEAKRLAEEGVKIPILVIHQGGAQQAPATLNGCAGNLANSDIMAIIQHLDPSIKIIVSGHTHNEYRCVVTVNGVTRLITSASSFGRILTDLTLTVDKRGNLVAASAENVIVDNALNPSTPGAVRQPDLSKADPAVAAVVQQYVTASAPLANTVIGRVQGDLTRAPSARGETTLGDVIADAQLVATADPGKGNAVIAFMNPGGVRADLLASAISSGGEAVGEVTYGEAFTVQPFGNSLVTKTMTGAQVRSLLEQQFPGCGGQTTQRILQISSSLKYQQIPAAGTCAGRIGTIWLNGAVLDPAATLRVTMNSFLATGGDGFTVFNQGTDPLGGDVDIDAFAAYLTAATGGLAVPALDRIVPVV
jgi:5'-nucleotidase